MRTAVSWKTDWVGYSVFQLSGAVLRSSEFASFLKLVQWEYYTHSNAGKQWERYEVGVLQGPILDWIQSAFLLIWEYTNQKRRSGVGRLQVLWKNKNLSSNKKIKTPSLRQSLLLLATIVIIHSAAISVWALLCSLWRPQFHCHILMNELIESWLLLY